MSSEINDSNSSGYEKYKHIVHDFLSHLCLSPSRYQDNYFISKDSAEKIFTRLKKAQIIYKNTKETNKLNDDLINNVYFNDKYLNTVIISSIVSREDSQVASDSIQYIFKDVPFRIYDHIAKQSVKNLGENFLKYIDIKKYQYIQSLIKTDYGFYYECEVESSKLTTMKEKLFDKPALAVPLELFFFKSEMYVYFFFIKEKKYQIINSASIESLKKIREIYPMPQSKEIINHNINKFIFGESRSDNSITIWIPAILLGIIYESGMIEKFEILNEADRFTTLASSPIYIEPKVRKNFDLNIPMEESREIFNTLFRHQKLKVKIFGNQANLTLIIKLYLDQIELVEYKSVKKFIKPFLKQIYEGKFVLILWIFIAFFIGLFIGK